MRIYLMTALVLFSLAASAQYYYKDIVGTQESSTMFRAYQKSKVSRVVLSSFDADNHKFEDFYVEQNYNTAARSLKTVSRSGITNESILISYADENGNVIRTVDSSELVVTATVYTYNSNGQLISLVSSSADSMGTSNESEQHIWQWNNNKPVRMLRIKNKFDTTFVNFKLDDKGNVSEETETRRGVTTQPVFYYYNDNNLLTDIVRFSKRANRLLPEYMFEYSAEGRVIQKITVPPNSSDYLIWRFQYNGQGLKIKEVIYDKQKKLTGKVEYQYSFS